MDLPEFLNKLTLLVNAGETVQRALLRCTAAGSTESPLYRELQQMANELTNNISLKRAMEDFSRRCAVQEVSQFTTTLLLNYKRGGEEFVTALRELSRSLWERRKALTKTMGEEASSKLVFPMVVIFLIVTVIVASPAVLLMNH
ncbi:type II secretion system F family protein [Paenibacillus sp. CC-CFT747]|nr:type II secretion system F family protein [Paenibacillus sp. CC-CFT747]